MPANPAPAPPTPLACSWANFQRRLVRCPDTDILLDWSRMGAGDEILAGPKPARCQAAMAELEQGSIANPDERRMVGHFWLRTPELAPTGEISSAIETMQRQVARFAADVHAGEIAPPEGGTFQTLLLIGIGGSALGPQLAADALVAADAPMRFLCMDNTDPEGFQRVFAALGKEGLRDTLTLVISKSGGTKETRNGMLAAQAAMESAGLAWAPRAAAVTGAGSTLDQLAEEGDWLARFPMWDWVGGRFSISCAVGLLPMALLGADWRGFLKGMAAMDAQSRSAEPAANIPLLLALLWNSATEGHAKRAMVALPYRDRLALLGRYLQQLIMESLGKELDLAGRPANQGLVVYGNKGSTDQHAFVQQLREGPDDCFACFVEARRSAPGADDLEVEPGTRSGDFLAGFLNGTRAALAEKGRRSMTLSLPRVDAASLGALLACFEGAVGRYATLIGINAYHQPGVEAGKKAAGRYLLRLAAVREALAAEPQSAEEIARSIGEEPEAVWHALGRLNASGAADAQRGATPAEDRFVRG